MNYTVGFSPEAERDLISIYDYIAGAGSRSRADAYVQRLIACCQSFSDFPQRGTRRDDIRPGLRTIGFQGSAVVAFHVDGDRVTIDRLLYRGRDIDAGLK